MYAKQVSTHYQPSPSRQSWWQRDSYPGPLGSEPQTAPPALKPLRKPAASGLLFPLDRLCVILNTTHVRISLHGVGGTAPGPGHTGTSGLDPTLADIVFKCEPGGPGPQRWKLWQQLPV